MRKFAVLFFGLVVMIMNAVPVLAQTATNLDNVFAAADVSTMATKVTTILVALIGVALLFLGYKYIRRSMR